MAIKLPQNILNSQLDSVTLSSFPIVNAVDVDFRETTGEKTSGEILDDDTLVLQMSDPVDSANTYHTPISAVSEYIGTNIGISNYLPLTGGILTGGLSAVTLSGDASALTAGDSDLLEGHDASYFATSTHNHDSTYLKLVGGTMGLTTDLNINTNAAVSNPRILFGDYDSGRVGIGTDSTVNGIKLTVVGGLTADSISSTTLYANNISGNGADISGVIAADSAKLDGLLPNEYSLTGHTHSYLPLSGGTVTGPSYFSDGSGLTAIKLICDFFAPRPQDTMTFNVNDYGMLFDNSGGDPFDAIFSGGTVISDYFEGDGTDITNVNAVQLGGNLPSYYSATSHTHAFMPLSGGDVDLSVDFNMTTSHPVANNKLVFGDYQTGKVGVGTDAPNHKLTVDGSISSSNTIYSSAFDGNGSSLTNLTWTNISNTAHEHTWDEISNTAHDHDETYAPISHTHNYLSTSGGTLDLTAADFKVQNGATQILYANRSNGFIGIGNTNPNYKLTVEGSISASTYIYTAGSISSENNIYGASIYGTIYSNNFNYQSLQDVVFNADGGYKFQFTGRSLFTKSITAGYISLEDSYFYGLSAITLSAGTIYEDGSSLASTYAALSHTHTYLPLNGGVLDGPLTSNNSATFNEGGDDYDFRIESKDNENMFFVDGGANNVGIGTNTPNHKLTVAGSISASDTVYSASAYSLSGTFVDELVIPVLASDPASPKAGQIWFISS